MSDWRGAELRGRRRTNTESEHNQTVLRAKCLGLGYGDAGKDRLGSARTGDQGGSAARDANRALQGLRVIGMVVGDYSSR
jgi:hypothetical protein